MRYTITHKKGATLLFALIAGAMGVCAQTHYSVVYTNDDNVYSFQRQATIREDELSDKTLADVVNEINSYTYPANGDHPTHVCKVVVKGDVEANEAALAALDVEVMDLSQAKGITTSFRNANVMYVIFPDGWDKERVNTTSESLKALPGSKFVCAASIIPSTETVQKWAYETTDGKKIILENQGAVSNNGDNTGTATVTTTVPLTQISKVMKDSEGNVYEGNVIVKDGQTYGTTSTNFFPINSYEAAYWNGSPYQTLTGYLRQDAEGNYRGVIAQDPDGNGWHSLFEEPVKYTFTVNGSQKAVFNGHTYTDEWGNVKSLSNGNYYLAADCPARIGDWDIPYIHVGGERVELQEATVDAWTYDWDNKPFTGEYTRTENGNTYGVTGLWTSPEEVKIERIDEVWQYSWGAVYDGSNGEPEERDGKYYMWGNEVVRAQVTTLRKVSDGSTFTGKYYTSSVDGKFYYFQNCGEFKLTKTSISAYTYNNGVENVVYNGQVYGENIGYIGGEDKQVVRPNNNCSFVSDDGYYCVDGNNTVDLTAVPADATPTYTYVGQYNGQDVRILFEGNVYTMRFENGRLVEDDIRRGCVNPLTEADLVYERIYYREDNINDIYTGPRTDDNTMGYQGGDTFPISVEYKYSYVTDVLPIVKGTHTSPTPLSELAVEQTVNVAYTDVEQETGKVDMVAYLSKPGTMQYVAEHIRQFGSAYYTWEQSDPWINLHGEKSGYGYSCVQNSQNVLEKLTVSGLVCARDILNGGSFTPDGHLISDKEGDYTLAPSHDDEKVKYPSQAEYGYGSSKVALTSCSYSAIDLSDAEFLDEEGNYYPNDMKMGTMLNSLAEIVLPTSDSQYIIPESFIDNSQHIKKVHIPYNYQEIQYKAFAATSAGPTHYTTVAGADDEVSGLKKGDIVDNGNNTLSLSSNIKFIATAAFDTKQGAALFEDIYVLAKQAPVCQYLAFSREVYVGNGGHIDDHSVRKGNYVCTAAGMAMLHYPAGCTDQESWNYTDVARNYDKYDETGDNDNSGNIYVWPTQSQYCRSYNQAIMGVTWKSWIEHDGWNPGTLYNTYTPYGPDGGADRNTMYGAVSSKSGSYDVYHTADEVQAGDCNDFTEYSEENKQCKGHPASYGSGWSELWLNESGITAAEWDDSWQTAMTTVPAGEVQPLAYDWRKYMGWHQFVLVENYDYSHTEPVKPGEPKKTYLNVTKYNRNDWYSFCVPYNITRKQVIEMFGNPETGKKPYVVTLSGAVRDVNKQLLTLRLSKNLCDYKLTYTEDNTVDLDEVELKPQYEKRPEGDDEVIIEANKPYLIYPQLPQSVLDDLANGGNRKVEVTRVEPTDSKHVDFPIAVSVHAVLGDNSTQMYEGYCSAKNENVDDTAKAYRYYFVGNYIDIPMPVYAYYLGISSKTKKSTLFRNTKNTRVWSKNSAVIFSLTPDAGVFKKTGTETTNYKHFVRPVDDLTLKIGSAGMEAQTMSLAFSFFDEDVEATKVLVPSADDTMHFVSPDANVYTIGGQCIGKYRDNLPKGIYVIEGQKIVIE